jgi:DnaK suppressor protein
MPNEAPTAASPATDYAALLQSERTSLHAQLEELGYGNEGDTGLNYDSNFADSSQVTAERGEAERLATELQDALDDVDAALVRLSDGNYGVCEVCGKPIGEARLEAMPAARLCIVDAAKQ